LAKSIGRILGGWGPRVRRRRAIDAQEAGNQYETIRKPP